MNARRLSILARSARVPLPLRRAALLLEAMLALALLVTASSLLVSIIRDAGSRLDRAIGVGEAADLARGAIAQIEAGLATPETLNGAAALWDPEALLSDAASPPMDSDEIPLASAARDPLWRLEIETEPSPFEALTLVSVTAQRDDRPRDRFTFHQLVDLGDPPADEVGGEDELVELIERAAEDASREGGSP